MFWISDVEEANFYCKRTEIGAKGIDIDDTMVDFCLSKGLTWSVEAISYLKKLEDKVLMEFLLTRGS